MDLAFDSLARWLPLYMTGRVTSYFYPRMRDNLHRRTLIVVPGHIAMTSNSVARGGSNITTVVTTDQRLTQAYAAQFQDYLDLCHPMHNIYTDTDSLLQCLTQFLSQNGARIQRVNSLSAETSPPELVSYCIDQIHHPGLEQLGYLYLHELDPIRENREFCEFIDIACLASAQDVRDGKVPIILSCSIGSQPLYYTVDTYVLHLKHILHTLETCENYHFVPLDIKALSEGLLMVKDGYKALLAKLYPPPQQQASTHISNSVHSPDGISLTVFEISQPAIVQLCQEHLFRLADQIGYTGAHRVQIISRIKQKIRELQT